MQPLIAGAPAAPHSLAGMPLLPVFYAGESNKTRNRRDFLQNCGKFMKISPEILPRLLLFRLLCPAAPSARPARRQKPRQFPPQPGKIGKIAPIHLGHSQYYC